MVYYSLDRSLQTDRHHYAALGREMQEETARTPKKLNPQRTIKAEEGASSGIYANNSTIHTTGTKVMIS